MNHLNLPTNPAIAEKVVSAQAEADKARLDRGLVGIVFGTKDHVPNNVAAIVAASGIIAIILMCILADDWAQAKDRVAGIGAFVTLALGYLFGRAAKSD